MFSSETLAPSVNQLSHHDAQSVADWARGKGQRQRLILDLQTVSEVTTAAFARLILLRRELRRNGGELLLQGLHDKVRGLYEINRLHDVLPQC